MSLPHAILVLLEREPGSGYDLTQRFKQGIGNFWQASHQQIYQQLKRLSEAGEVAYTSDAQAGKPDRKVYRLTPAGQQRLASWLAEPARPPIVRDALLINVFAAHLGDRDRLLAELDRHLDEHRETLARHRAAEADWFAASETTRRAWRLPYLTLRRGIRYEQDWIAWLAEARELIASDALPEAPVPEV